METPKLRGLLDPVLAFSRVLGVFPLSKELRLSKMLTSISISMVSLLLVAFVVIGNRSLLGAFDENDKYRIIVYFRLTFLVLIPAANVLKLVLHSKEFQDLVSSLQANETNLRRANLRANYDRRFLCRTVMARLLLIFIHEGFVICFGNFRRFENILRNVYFVSGLILVQLVQIQLYTFLHILESQLDFLLLLAGRKKQRKEPDALLVLQIHNRLLTSGYLLNALYSHQNLFIIIFGYLSFITSAYNIALNVRAYLSTGVVDLLETIEKITWVVYSLIDMYTFARKCLTTSKKGENVSKALYRLVVCSKQREHLQNTKLRLHFIVDRKMEFTACDLFHIDYTFIHSVLASTLTLLVIMIQMT